MFITNMEGFLTVLVAVTLVSRGQGSMFDLIPDLGPPSMTCTEIKPSGNTPIYFRSAGTYPYSYYNDHDACWVIKSGEEGVKPRLRVTFSALEALYGLCTTSDFIEIRDGNSFNGTQMLRWCGWGHPNFVFVPSGAELFVYFHTDSTISTGGFEMKAYLNETAEVLTSAEDGPAGWTRNQFNNHLREHQASTSSGTNGTGMIVGIVIGVMLGVVLLGVAIHIITKSCIMKNQPPSNPLENIIIPKRRNPVGFDAVETGGHQGAVGGHPVGDIAQNCGKYALPGPLVSAPPGPLPSLVFANANAPGYTPAAGRTNHSFYPDAPLPAIASALPGNIRVSPDNLLTTKSNTPVDRTSTIGDVENDAVT